MASCFSPPSKSFSKNKESTNKTKVLHLHTRAIVGGSGANVLLTLEKVSQEKFIGHLACGIKGAQENYLSLIQSKNIIFHPLPHLVNQINPLEDVVAFFEIVRLIRREHYTIVHTHNSKAGILGRLAAKICRVPIIIHTIHSCEFHYEKTSFLARRLFILLEKLAARFTSHFIAISEHLKGEFIKYGVTSEEKISVIYSGIEIEKFKSAAHFVDATKKREQLGLMRDDFVVGVIARLEKGKGHDDILQAIPLILGEQKNVKFLFVGDGRLKEKLIKEVNKKNLQPYVIFLGLRSDVVEILQAVDIVCLPSYYEGMGRVLLEAQASGKAVVATRVGGIPEIVEEGKTAILVEPKNPHSLAQAILKLANDAQSAEKMGMAGSIFVGDCFSAGKMAGDIYMLYERRLAQVSGGVCDQRFRH